MRPSRAFVREKTGRRPVPAGSTSRRLPRHDALEMARPHLRILLAAIDHSSSKAHLTRRSAGHPMST